MQVPNARKMIETWQAFQADCVLKRDLAEGAGNTCAVHLYEYLIENVIPDELEFWKETVNNDVDDDGN